MLLLGDFSQQLVRLNCQNCKKVLFTTGGRGKQHKVCHLVDRKMYQLETGLQPGARLFK